jgi:hypothetical protein
MAIKQNLIEKKTKNNENENEKRKKGKKTFLALKKTHNK